MQALVPTVDLFAVLAIVFMLHSSEEITDAKAENDVRMQELIAEVQEARLALQGIDEAERARRARRELLANSASKSLEQIKEERERKAQELLTQFTEMLTAQQSNAAAEYEDILARIEDQHEEELEKEVISLEKEKQAELDRTRAELAEDLETTKSELAEEQEKRLEEAKEEFEEVLSSTEKVLANAQDALVDAEQERVEALAKQEADLDARRRLAVAETEQRLKEQADREAEDLRRETELALATAEQKRLDALTKQGAALEEEKELALARAEQERLDALAKQGAELDAQRRLELAGAVQELKEQADREAANSKREAELALARADLEHQGDLAAQKSALEQEKAKALSEAAEELAPYIRALEAKNKIIEELNENFKDFDTSAVEIDLETGKVKLHFEKSYFSLASHELSEDMKSFLRIMIPKYAKGIYGNKDAAAHVESLNISGMASPVYKGVYIDIHDNSPETEDARKYNMALSNRRANALYDFIFDEDEMGDYEFRSRLEADMSIAALGFQNATPVKAALVGKPARCIEYDCRQEQATVLQFQLFSRE